MTIPLILLTLAALGFGGWYFMEQQKKAKAQQLLEIMGDHDVPTETGTRMKTTNRGVGRNDTEAWTYARADLPHAWKDFEAELGESRVSDAGVDPMVFTDPREVTKLICWTASIQCQNALKDEGLRRAVWQFLERGGSISDGSVEIEVARAQDAMGMASLQSDVADMVSRLKLKLE